MNGYRILSCSVLVAALLACMQSPTVHAQNSKRPFAVADEVGLTLIIGEGEPCARFSPDGKYVAVFSERGRVDLNQVEDSLRFYRSQDIEDFLAHPGSSQPPSPIWIVSRSAKEAGTSGEDVISGWRWLDNSTAVGFVGLKDDGNRELVLADLQKMKTEVLTSDDENVDRFDIRDRSRYVYTASRPNEGLEKVRAERRMAAIVGTGHSIEELILPDDPRTQQLFSHRTHDLWAVVDGTRFQVNHDNAPIVSSSDLVISPDGRSVVTTLPLPEVPKAWETLYPPPFASSPYHIHAGNGSAHHYVRIDLQTDAIEPLTYAPTSSDAGWDVLGKPSWSSDGDEIVLPGTFLQSKDNAPSRPCVAVVDFRSNTRACVEVLKARTETGVEEGFHRVFVVQFAPGDKNRVLVTFQKHGEDWFSLGTTEYQRRPNGTWRIVGEREGMPGANREGLEITIKQAFNQVPLLVASNKRTSRVIWETNPQLKDFALGEASVYTWKDKYGYSLKGGLFKPPRYMPGHRYPLVIQTHGFDGSFFFPSGSFPTAFAASELAAAGIIVLQAEDVASGCAAAATPQEGPCAIDSYESAAHQLVSDGLVDPERIGIIGFSRSCFYVMEALTTGSVHFMAAAVTDGVTFDYWQYMLDPDAMAAEGNSIIGVPPIGDGLQQWFKRSPGFNLDKVRTPLRIVGVGPTSVLEMWQPYAGLHYLKKPVDLIMLNAFAHVLTNPAERIVAQGGTVDWFRFWLQGYEDPDPAKAEQYARWHELKKLQSENESKSGNQNSN